MERIVLMSIEVMMRRWRRIRRKDLVFERGSATVGGGWQSGVPEIGRRGVVISSVRG